MKKKTSQLAYIITGLGYGDEGKGTIVDWIARQHDKNSTVVIRHNGGGQAAHNVVLSNGKRHTFSHFGSGTLSGVRTFLSNYMIINPAAMLNEAAALSSVFGICNPLGLVTVNENCLMTSPFQIASNRLKELLRGDKKHGSCGVGISETIQDFIDDSKLTIFAKDFNNKALLRKKLLLQKERKIEYFTPFLKEIEDDFRKSNEWFAIQDSADLLLDRTLEKISEWATKVTVTDIRYTKKLINETQTLIFEGAQGALLDQNYGFFPFVTRSTTIPDNALGLLKGCGYAGGIKNYGISRVFQTRHGAGPFPTESSLLQSLAKKDINKQNQWQGEFRVGYLDLVTLKYATDVIAINKKLDGIIFTHVDEILRNNFDVCENYKVEENKFIKSNEIMIEGKERRTTELFRVEPIYHLWNLKQISEFITIPIVAQSSGPTEKDKKWIQ